MGMYFLDSSTIVKRYVSEAGTAWVTDLASPESVHHLHMAAISAVEVVAAIFRRQRSEGGSLSVARTACHRFRDEFPDRFVVIELTPALRSRAMDFAEKHALRGYDAVQLAAAVQVHRECQAFGTSCTLVSADAELNAAAIAEGLAVENPNDHA